MHQADASSEGGRVEWYKRVYVRVVFREDEFGAFVEDLAQTYPDEWFAIAVCDTDRETGLSRGEILGHSYDGSLPGAVAGEYHDSYPDRVIKVFRTGRRP